MAVQKINLGTEPHGVGGDSYRTANEKINSNFEGIGKDIQDVLDVVMTGDFSKTAYDIAVKNGFVGSEQEWLASLKGEQGASGREGLTAYEVARKNGYVGSESAWLNSLIGEKGERGVGLAYVSHNKNDTLTFLFTDYTSYTTRSLKGDQGIQGPEAKSVYDIAVSHGFEGNEEDWLNYILENSETVSDLFADADSLERFINGSDSETVLTRLSAEYPTLQKAIKELFENGGLPATPFATKALMTASALVDGDYAQVTDDTVNNGLYVKTAGAWVKSGYDPLAQAISYADANKLDLDSIFYDYVDGNKVGNRTKTVEGFGLNGAYTYLFGTTYTSKIMPVSVGNDLYVLNDKANYASTSGNGYAFFDDDPSVNKSAIRITDNRVAAVDAETSLAYHRVTVPVGAKYLVINSRFTTDTNWAIHKGAFSSSYEQGTEVLFSVNGATIEEQIKPSLVNTLEQGNKALGDLYQPSGVLYNRYLNVANSLTFGTDWSAFRFKVSEGSSYYLKIIGAQAYPFRVAYSKSFDGISKDTTNAGSATLTLTNQENIYKLTVPTGLGIVAVFMNIKVDTGSFTLNITDTLSIQEGHFEDADIGKSVSGISSINGNAIVDTYARAKLDEQGSAETKSRLSGKKVFALGDSITQGTRGGYVKYLEDAFGTTVTNYGHSGGRASRVADQVTAGDGLPRRDSPTASTAWPVMDFTDLACVTLMIGTNDSDTSSWGTLDELPKTNIGDHATPAEYWALFPNNYLPNIALVIEYIKLKAPKCEIHLITPPYRFNAAAGTERIAKLIPSLEAVAKYYGVHLIYATYESGISYKFMEGSLDFYSYDGTHFNELGNEVFGKFLAQKVLSFG